MPTLETDDRLSRTTRRWPWRRPLAGGGSRLRRAVAVMGATAVAATTLSGCIGGPSPTKVTAIFKTAQGLFPGNAVDVLGVAVGTVTSVHPTGTEVVVQLSINGGRSVPANVHATLTNPQLLGEPSIQLSPGYTGGPKLADHAVIPMSRTSVPISTNRLLLDLQTYLAKINPHAVGGVVTNLSQDLKGQGQGLNTLIHQAAGTLQLLARKGNDLGRLNGTLAQITGVLRQHTATITSLLQSYDTVSGILAANSGPLGSSIKELAATSQQIAQLLSPNLKPLVQDIGTITQVGRTLDRNLPSIDLGLSSSVALFSAAGRAYDPLYNWLNLNNQLPPGTTSAIVAGLVRDRLAGICRRILANHSQGLSSAQKQTLATCGNPASGYFNQLFGLIPSIVNGSSGSGSAPSAQSLLATGASQIPGLTQAQSQQLTHVPASSLSGSNPAPSGSSLGSSVTLHPAAPQSPTTTSPSTTTTTSGGVGGLLNGLFGAIHLMGSLF